MSEVQLGFTAQMMERYDDLVQSNVEHPFIARLASGNLPEEVFRRYLLQDAYYLREYSRVLSFLGATLAEDEARVFFQGEAQVSVLNEQESLLPYYTQLSITKEEILNVTPTPTCLLYTSYLKSLCSFGSSSELLAAVLPCFTVYAFIAKKLGRGIETHHPYYEWIRSYGGEYFQRSARAAGEHTDRVAQGASLRELERMEKAFRTALILEYKFWEAAYTDECWPLDIQHHCTLRTES